MMRELPDGVPPFIVAITGLVSVILASSGKTIKWLTERRDKREEKAEKKRAEAEQPVTETFEDLKQTVRLQAELIETQRSMLDNLERDYARCTELVAAQDNRMTRKDERMRHLEREVRILTLALRDGGRLGEGNGGQG